MTPIYKDTFYTSTGATDIIYTLSDGTNTIFSGRAYKYPDGNALSVNINRICQSHLNSEIPDIWSSNSGNVNLPDAIKTFHMFNSAGTQLASYEFINDWSYTPTASTLSNPINGRYATGQYAFTSTVNSGKVKVQYSKPGSLCGEWAVYYSNLKSGWDSFLIEGKVIENKDITHYGYRKDINNNTKGRSLNRYQSNIELNWEVNTGWLTDAQSKILYDNLLTSNNIYLHNLVSGEIFPVSIEDTAVTNKQFKNEKMLIAYKMTLKADNTRIRK